MRAIGQNGHIFTFNGSAYTCVQYRQVIVSWKKWVVNLHSKYSQGHQWLKIYNYFFCICVGTTNVLRSGGASAFQLYFNSCQPKFKRTKNLLLAINAPSTVHSTQAPVACVTLNIQHKSTVPVQNVIICRLIRTSDSRLKLSSLSFNQRREISHGINTV